LGHLREGISASGFSFLRLKVSDMPDEISSYEPSLAFDGGAFAINLIRRLITDAEKSLCKDGYLAIEVGLGQGDIIKNRSRNRPFIKILEQ